jgi:transcriptional regulator with XRE-family HTH domain
MTLEELAAASGLDKGNLSKVERGAKDPSVAMLVQVANALKVKVAHLLGEATFDSAISVVRVGDRKPIGRLGHKGERVDEALIAADPMRSIESFVVYPGHELVPHDLVEHHGEEMVFVLQGQIELQLTDRAISLAEGDCVHFLGKLPHKLRQKGRKKAIALLVIAKR